MQADAGLHALAFALRFPAAQSSDAAIAQLVRALDCGSRGPPFEPGWRYHVKLLANLAVIPSADPETFRTAAGVIAHRLAAVRPCTRIVGRARGRSSRSACTSSFCGARAGSTPTCGPCSQTRRGLARERANRAASCPAAAGSAAAAASVSGRDRKFRPAALEILESPPAPIALMATISAFALALLVWSNVPSTRALAHDLRTAPERGPPWRQSF